MQRIAANDPRLRWKGAVSVEESEGGVRPWRLPLNDLEFYPGASGPAGQPSGVRLELTTDAGVVVLETEPLAAAHAADLCIDDEIVRTARFGSGKRHLVFADLPAGEKTVAIWLPPSCPVRLLAVEIPVGSRLLPPPSEARPRWIHWGSSISQCNAAASGATTWPAIVARRCGLDLTSFGFSGNCFIEPMVARLIRDLPADAISMKLGINVMGQGALSLRTFRPAVLGAMTLVREKHPDVPLIVASPIFCPHREEAPNGAGMTLQIMRSEIAEAVGLLSARGDSHVHYVDGLSLFGPDLAGYLPDNLHPNAEGYRLLAENFLKATAEWLPRQVRAEAGA